MRTVSNIFDGGGFPSLGDLETEDWRNLYERLEREQRDFLAQEGSFRSREYRWPRDPLHSWSRLWEYPFVLHHLEHLSRTMPRNDLLKVADIGSGVTFFPFSVARLGYDVTCVDIDPVCERDIPAAAKAVAHAPGKVSIRLMEGARIRLPDASQDAVYCISVLEHVSNFDETIDEVARILKPGGKFILTVDIDLRGDSELSVSAFGLLQERLAANFAKAIPERCVHPAALLTSENSPYPFSQPSTIALVRRIAKNALNGRLVGGRAAVCLYLTVYAAVLVKDGQ